jgi:hypothetical protein
LPSTPPPPVTLIGDIVSDFLDFAPQSKGEFSLAAGSFDVTFATILRAAGRTTFIAALRAHKGAK